jgi:hypothetical protein
VRGGTSFCEAPQSALGGPEREKLSQRFRGKWAGRLATPSLSPRSGSSIFGADSWWRLWLYGDAVFTDEDVEQTWRFIVKKMPHVLRAL